MSEMKNFLKELADNPAARGRGYTHTALMQGLIAETKAHGKIIYALTDLGFQAIGTTRKGWQAFKEREAAQAKAVAESQAKIKEREAARSAVAANVKKKV